MLKYFRFDNEATTFTHSHGATIMDGKFNELKLSVLKRSVF